MAKPVERFDMSDGSACVLKLTDGTPVLVDQGDYKWLSQWTWWFTTDGYAYRQDNLKEHVSSGRPKRRHALMHRAILQPKAGEIVDHINRNKLDNRRSNLRIVGNSVNMHNTDLRSTNTSGHKGVSWNARRQRWRAYIGIGMRRIELGYYRRIEDAIAARVDAEERYAEECGFQCLTR